MGTMIGNNGLRDTKPKNNVIEYELGSYFTVSDKCRHCFGPFGEVVHSYDDISMPPVREIGRASCRERVSSPV